MKRLSVGGFVGHIASGRLYPALLALSSAWSNYCCGHPGTGQPTVSSACIVCQRIFVSRVPHAFTCMSCTNLTAWYGGRHRVMTGRRSLARWIRFIRAMPRRRAASRPASGRRPMFRDDAASDSRQPAILQSPVRFLQHERQPY